MWHMMYKNKNKKNKNNLFRNTCVGYNTDLCYKYKVIQGTDIITSAASLWYHHAWHVDVDNSNTGQHFDLPGASGPCNICIECIKLTNL